MKVGSHHSVETKANISASMMGNTNLLGYHFSDKSKEKMSASATGRIQSPETCEKISASRMGHFVSSKTRANISASQIGYMQETSRNWKGGVIESTRRRVLKRRGLGFNPLNSWFSGCEAHHINKDDVIYMPRKLHRSIYHNQYTGQGMVQMNALAGAFLTEDWT